MWDSVCDKGPRHEQPYDALSYHVAISVVSLHNTLFLNPVNCSWAQKYKRRLEMGVVSHDFCGAAKSKLGRRNGEVSEGSPWNCQLHVHSVQIRSWSLISSQFLLQHPLIKMARSHLLKQDSQNQRLPDDLIT